MSVMFWLRSYWRVDQLTRQYASYPYSQKATEDAEAGFPNFRGTIIERRISADRGRIRFTGRRTVDHFDLSAKNVKDFSEYYPPGIRYLIDSRETFVPFGGSRWHFQRWNVWDSEIVFDRLGVFIGSCSISGLSQFTQFNGWEVEIPVWVLVLVTGILPAKRGRTILRLRRIRPDHLCRSCFYDLTGNASGICPECGTRKHEDAKETLITENTE
jgi:RimJ/RimL family protein N-acetyltransferase